MSRRAVVLGGADCVWDDFERLEEMIGQPWPGLVIAVNDAGWAFPRKIDHWVSLEAENFQRKKSWEDRRRSNGYPGGYETWGGIWCTGTDDTELVDHAIPVDLVGSSGYHAAYEVAVRHLFMKRVPICGIPMTGDPHFFDAEPWNGFRSHRFAWERSVEVFNGRIRSMSGWTRDLLGEPTPDWLGLG